MDGLRTAAHIELGNDLLEVELDRVLGHEEAAGDFLVGDAVAEEAEDFVLALLRQGFDAAARSLT